MAQFSLANEYNLTTTRKANIYVFPEIHDFINRYIVETWVAAKNLATYSMAVVNELVTVSNIL
jgi:hypothetical protein